MANNSRTHECLTKLCSSVTSGRVFQIALGVRGISFSRGNGKFCWVQNSSLSSFRLKINICMLELSILFSKDLLSLYYIQVIIFWFFWEKLIFLIYFNLLFSPGYVLDFMMHHTYYTILFFPKIEKATFKNKFGLKTKLFSRF